VLEVTRHIVVIFFSFNSVFYTVTIALHSCEADRKLRLSQVVCLLFYELVLVCVSATGLQSCDSVACVQGLRVVCSRGYCDVLAIVMAN
jgi:hypothetical protein